MRSSTKTFVASVGLGVCALSYAIGANSATGANFMANGAPSLTNTPVATDPASAAPTTSTDDGNSAGAGDTTSTGTASKPTKKPAIKTGSAGSGKAPSSSGSAAPVPSQSTAPAPSQSTALAPSHSTAPAPAPSQTTAPIPSHSTAPAQTTVTKTGDVKSGLSNDPYRDYAQLTVTKVNGKVTAVNVDQGFATHGWSQYYPYFAQLAVQSNGADIGNYSGATYASAAFNAALKSAMSKF